MNPRISEYSGKNKIKLFQFEEAAI